MRRSKSWGSESGLSLLELLLVVAVISVIASLAFMQIASARERTRRDSAARQFTGHLDRARADSIRRHAAAGQEASVAVVNANSYRVVADFNNNGTIEAGEARTYTLPDGVTFVTTPTPPTAAFDWRGRLAGTMNFQFTNSTGSTNVNLTAAGDSTLNASVTLPTISATPFPTPTPTPTPSPTPTPGGPGGVGGCSIALYPFALTIRKNGLSSGTLELKGSVYGDPGQATITFDSTLVRLTYGNNTQATPGQTFTIGPTTPVSFTVRDIKNTTANYTTNVDVTSNCGDYSTSITVSN